MEYEALDDFESPWLGKVKKKDTLVLTEGEASRWLTAGMIREKTKKNPAPVKGRDKEALDE